MPRLAIYLLGPPRVELDGNGLHIARRKALALLAFLTLERQRHSRDTLAALLWPELNTAHARGYLRRTLSELNRKLGGQTVSADRETVSINPEASVWVDATWFRELLATCEAHGHPRQQACADCMARLSEALDLYHGGFMAGFSFPDSLAFDEWHRYQSAQLRDELEGVLERLIAGHCALAEHEQAIATTRRWLEMDPLHEPAHRTLIALLAQTGRRAAALRQYQECLRALEEEFGIPPAPETTALYERIAALRPDQVGTPTQESVTIVPPDLLPSPQLPGFLRDEAAAESERPVFVARERELSLLQAYLDRAQTGKAGVVFVTGGPGRGKTALMGEFARQAMDAHGDLLVGMGSCNAYSGIGDPYLPFRGVVGMLTGDVESKWAAGAISRDHACRMWAAVPQVAHVLLEHGPVLIDIFVPGSALLSRAKAGAADRPAWLGRLEELVEGERAEPGELGQSQLFESYTQVLRALATGHPLLLLLDDLQWADSASISLLFHLGRELADSGGRVLIVGAYRPAEVALGRPGVDASDRRERVRHPLEKVLAELKRRYGDVWLDLARADEDRGRPFIDAYLDTEPNQLDEGFREALLQHTSGHPLFTVELLREMQERGDLAWEDGVWVEGPAVDWAALPARVEGVIEERIGRLDEESRDLLSIASVEGETFTAQVVARVGEIGERRLLRALSRDLEGRHQLVREDERLQVGLRQASRYHFAHALYQRYLYEALSAAERALLHGEVGDALEELYVGSAEEILPQLAHHYAEAGKMGKAVEYLILAGDRARVAYAHTEAVEYYQRALVILKEREEYQRAARTLMKLGLAHCTALQFRQARQAYDQGFELWLRAGGPSESLPNPPHALRLVRPEPLTLDPGRAQDGASLTIANELFAGLGRLTKEMELVPDLARSWEISGDGRRYTFHLRDNARWTDGVPVTSRDFRYAWLRMLEPGSGSGRVQDLFDVKGARLFHQGQIGAEEVGLRALDDWTLTVELEEPAGTFLESVATTKPVPRHVVEAYGEAWTEVGHIVTCGPFRLKTWKPSDSIVLERCHEYQGPFAGNVERVELCLVAGTTDAGVEGLRKYEADAVDLVELDFTETHRARRRYSDEYITAPRAELRFVGFDVRRPPFDDRRVRRALTFAVDKEKLAEVVLQGLADPATGGIIPPAMPGHSPGIGLPYRPALARELLLEAGYPNGRGFPRVEWLVAGIYNAGYALLQAQWKDDLGIEIEWQPVGMRRLVERLSEEPPQMIGVGYDTGLDPYDFLRTLMFQEQWGGWQDRTYDTLLAQARRERDQRQRLRLFARADAIVTEAALLIPLCYARKHLLVKPWVTLPMSPYGDVFWDDAIIRPH